MAGIFDSFIDGEVQKALNQAMPRLFMAKVMQEYLAEIPEKGAATPENVQERLKNIIDNVAKDTNTPWGEKGAWLGELWTKIVDEKVATGKSQQLTDFINDARFVKLFDENKELFAKVVSPDIMGPKGLNTRLGLAKDKEKLEGILGTVDAIAAESGLLSQDETLTATIDKKLETIEAPKDLNGYNVSPEAEKGCMEQFVALMASLFEGMFGESKEQAAAPEVPAPAKPEAEKETSIAIPPEALEALKGLNLDTNSNGRFDGAEITGENLDKVLGAIRANLNNNVMRSDLKDFDGNGAINSEDVVSGLNMLVQQSKAAKQGIN